MSCNCLPVPTAHLTSCSLQAVKKGSDHLGKAQTRGSSARTYYVTFMLVMTFVLLLLHMIAP